ncbi:MAG TPA: DUF58 domain-containing protein, partial [Solirubrobacteraceae bacterium]|nr:DUF58 domain-containing protein [Solirubrobacteraceae bacterium]
MSGARRLAGLGVALCLLGGAFAASALYVPGLTLLLLAAAAQLGVRAAAWGARLEREPPRANVEEGETVTITLRVHGALARWAGELCRVPGAEPERVPRAAGGAVTLAPTMSRRGLHRIGPSQLRIADPLAIAARELCSPDTEVLVLPRIEAIPARRLALLGAAPRDARAHRREPAGAEADGLRPYRPGTPANRIHWPSVARTGALIERQLSAERDRHALVVLDGRAPADGRAFDMCVRAAASLATGIARREGCGLLLPDVQRAYVLDPALSSWEPRHARLALLAPG